MFSSYPCGNEGGVLSEAGFAGWGGFSGWVGLGMEVVARIRIGGIFGFRTIERPWVDWWGYVDFGFLSGDGMCWFKFAADLRGLMESCGARLIHGVE